MRKPALLCAAAAVALFAAPASALTFSFSYSGAGLDFAGLPTVISASGTLTTTDTTTQVNGRDAYRITGISGARNGTAIDQLYAPGTPLDDLGNVNDNYLFVSGTYLSFLGAAFGVADDDFIYNLYYNSGVPLGYREFVSGPAPAGGPTGLADNPLTTFTITALDGPATPAPEPATWAMMLLGFAAVGLAARRRRGVAAVLA